MSEDVDVKDVDELDEGVSEDTNLSEQASIIMVNGVEFSAEDIKNLQSKEKNLQADYTRKTQVLAEERKVVDKEKSETERTKKFVMDLTDAYHEDVEHFTTHTVEENANYVPKQDVLLGKGKASTTTAKEIDIENHPEFRKLKSQVDEINKGQKVKEENEFRKEFDDTLLKAERLVIKKFPLAQVRDVKNEIYVFLKSNDQLPSEKQIEKFASTRHERQMKINTKAGVIKMNDKDDTTLPSSENAGAATGVTDENTIPDIKDTQTAIDNGRAFLEKRRLQREGGQ